MCSILKSNSLDANLPGAEARYAFEVGEDVADVNEAHRTSRVLQDGGNDCFVLDRVETAGGVHQSPPNLEKLASLESDLQLQGVEPNTIAGGPSAPDVRSLPDRSVSGTWNVAQDTVVLYLAVYLHTFTLTSVGCQDR